MIKPKTPGPLPGERPILIVGGRGMLGFELAKVLADLKPVVWDKAEIDIGNESSVHKLVTKLKPRLVINAAAYTDVDGCESNSGLAMQINGDAVGYLADACSEIDAVIVHLSTDYVFRGDQPDGYAEDDKPDPINAYGESKVRGEHLLAEGTSKYYLVRSAWLYGRNGRNFIDTMLSLANEKRVIKVVDDQIGSPTYAVDLASAIRRLVDQRSPFGIYHLVNQGQTSWYGLAQETFWLAKIDTPLQPVLSSEFPREARRPAWSILKNTKTEALRPWPDALADYLKTKG